MLDLTILRIMKHREYFETIGASIPEDALDVKTSTILKDFGKFFAETGHPVVKIGPFKTFFFNVYHPGLDKEQAAYYDTLLNSVEKDVDEATTRALCNRLVELSFATDVGNDADAYHREEDIDIIGTVGERHQRALEKLIGMEDEEIYVTDCISTLLDDDARQDGLRFNLPCLRDNIRTLRSSDFIIVAGRPDVGKTSFILSELRGIIPQVAEGRPVLWFNNEGEGGRIVKRWYSCLLGLDTHGLLEANRNGTLQADYTAAMGAGVFNVIDCHEWDTSMVERVIRDRNPSLCIFDMIDNIEFKGSMRSGHDQRTDQILEAQYQWARNLGVKYDMPVIATSQVSAAAEEQADTCCYPHQHMLKDSRTGKQGAADLIITVGKSQDPTCANQRYIGTPKNKLALPGSVNELREVSNYHAATGRYEGPRAGG